ncbi:PAS domain S-box protein [candidate division GN15 bacterium]|nr:PAS domain S-box protein [candidate division GN15 bacterium]
MDAERDQTGHRDDDEAALRRILAGTAATTGTEFFRALVKNLAAAIGTSGAWVTEYDQPKRKLRALAFWFAGEFVEKYEYVIDGTPCERAIADSRLVHYPDRIIELFPGDNDLPTMHAVSYMGVPLKDLDDRILGHLAVLDNKPMPEEPRSLALFQIFAARAAAELQRLRAESEVREREDKLGRLIDSALDAIIELDGGRTITRVNPAAEKLFGSVADDLVGRPLSGVIDTDSLEKLTGLCDELPRLPRGEQYLWVPGGFTARRPDGQTFPAEASLSCFEAQRKRFFTLIIRNVNDRIEAERRIEHLTEEREYLREELRDARGFGEIIGESAPVLRMLSDIDQVAATTATVLILGETGTGKEVIARSIHRASRRADKPMIKVNCAAIPANLIESELFGHEPGAFTGATKKREGRFALADGGTIFLDEVGELPLDLQSKLLRVLQEGEFEPVGSSQTRRVDVRVIAATNRNLAEAVRTRGFREDLYYRLNVFPITAPPLRQRGADIVRLAEAFASRYAAEIGREIEPLSSECKRRLMTYDWPGNVRELQNVIERAVITSRDGRLAPAGILPDTTRSSRSLEMQNGDGDHDAAVLTLADLQKLERENLVRALKQTEWRVSGRNGAARLLGMNASTLSSRLKALGIKRPGG